MSRKKYFRYKGVNLHCEPLCLPDHSFGAQVVITSLQGTLIKQKLYPALEHFKTEYEAVEVARQWAVGWINDQ